MTQLNNELNTEDRLNRILDKIKSIGLKSLDKKELDFLNSFKSEEEDSFNKKFNSDKIHSTYISDDGFFMFNVENVGYVKDELRISGVIFVPDLVVKKRVIKGEIKGQIIVFNNTEVGLDFLKGKYDIFDFVNGLEYELDRFIDDLIISIKWNMDFN